MKSTLKIYPERIIGEVPKYLFGHFLEYMYDCIDPGLWAELLISRGFENADKEQEGLSFPWKKTDKTVSCSLDMKVAYTPRQSQQVTNEANDFEGIQQNNLKLYENEVYRGYIWGYCEKPVTVMIRLLTSENNTLFEKEFRLESDKWQKLEYRFENKHLDENAVIQYLIDGKTTVWFDQSSLMPVTAVNGIWKNVMDYIRPLKSSMMRFPGGCAADCYFWEDGVGPRDKRPSRENEHWGGIEQNQFGTDDYISFCQDIGSEPLICVNFGSSTPEDAANWVEYCNGDIHTFYGKKRADNGHPEPYKVKYWEIGNEVFGSWEIGHCNAGEYIQKYKRFADAMKKKDQNIILLACGGDGGNLDQRWNQIVLKEGKGTFDALTLHFYAPLIDSSLVDDVRLYKAVVASPLKQERVLELTQRTMEKEDYKVPIAVTEWNCNYGESEQTGREQTIEAAVANAGLLNVFLRHAKEINICNASDLVNGWSGGIIRSNRGDAFGTATYHLIKMYAESEPERVVECDYVSDTYDTEGLGNIEPLEKIPYLDIVCCKNSNNELVVFAVNRHYEESIELDIQNGIIKKINRIWNKEILAKNTFDTPEQIKKEEEEGNFQKIELLPHSSYALIVELTN